MAATAALVFATGVAVAPFDGSDADDDLWF
jgi:hypothetical protein